MDALNNTNNFPVQNIQNTVSQTPVIPPPPPQNKFKKFLNTSSWVILVTLLPFTVLIFLSQNAVPGDLFYPMKRSLENVVLAAVSVNPATKAAFRTDLTETRFKEAQKLVLSKSDAVGLDGFIDEVEAAQIEVLNLKNETQRAKAQEKLISKINEYQNSLSTLQSKTEQNIPLVPTNSPTPTRVSNQNVSQAPQNFPSPTPKVYVTAKIKISPTIKPTSIPSLSSTAPSPTSAPTTAYLPSSLPSPTSVSTLEPTPTSIPFPTITLAPTEVPTEIPITPNTQIPHSEQIAISEKRKIALSLREARLALNKIKNDLEKSEKIEENNSTEEKLKTKKGNS